MSDVLWMALALVLVFEGLLPFINPTLWRQLFTQALQLTDQQLRTFGLVAILLGLAVLWGLG
jgi:uncharacterized protein